MKSAALLLSFGLALAQCRLFAPAQQQQSDTVTPARFSFKTSARPVLKLRKRVRALGEVLSLGCDYTLQDRLATFDATWYDHVVGGELSLKNLGRLEYRKLWLLPGMPCHRNGRRLAASAGRHHHSHARA